MQYKQLDGLRFIAVLSVILHHICPLPSFIAFNLGAFGVDLFFVISGFLITEILLREKIKGTSVLLTLKIFFSRRVLRIFPLFYLYILICLVIVPQQTKEHISWLLTYTINIWVVLKDQQPFWYFNHLWSLCVEEQFYIFWPFLIMITPIKRLRLLFILMIFIAIAIRLMVTIYFNGYALFNYTMLPTTFDCFGFGALLALLKEFKPILLNKIFRHKYFIILGILLVILNNKFGTVLTQQTFGKTLIAFVSFYLVGIAATIKYKNISRIILENKAVMYFGRISYGMYVYHLLIWGSFGKYFTDCWHNLHLTDSIYKSFFEFVFILICTILVSIISYELFEKRFLQLKKYISFSK